MDEHLSTRWPVVGGEMAARIRERDWADTLLGPVQAWPGSLRAVVDMLLANGFAMVALWGPDLVQIYNDRYRDLMGVKHPAGLGQATRDCWPEVWRINAPIYEKVLAGETVRIDDGLYPISRSGVLEDAWFTLAYSPLRDEKDNIAGVLVTVVETSERVRALRDSEARQTFLLKFSDALRAEPTEDAIVNLALRTLTEELKLDRCYQTVLYPEEDRTDVVREFRRPGLVPMPSTLRNSDFPEAEAQTFRGTLIFNDTASDPNLTDTDKRSLAAMNFGAFLSSPLRNATGYPFWALGAVSSEPRCWTSGEVALMEEATERTWVAVEHARVEAALRESEGQQAFLLKLPDALRSLANPADIQGETTRLLRERLNAGWCYYVEWDLDKKVGLVLRDSVREGLPSLVGAHDVSDAPEFLQLLAGGAVLSVSDYAGYEKLPVRTREKFAALGFRSMVAAPLITSGRLIATLLVGHTEIREWSISDSSLVAEVAERTWVAVERARAEAALRESAKRQAFLLKLSDALRAEPDADAVANRALDMLLDLLQLDRCYITYYRPADDEALIPYQIGNDTVPPLPAKVRLSAFPDAYEQVLDRTFVIEDDFERRGLSEAERASSKALGMRAMLASTIRRGERGPLASLMAVSCHPRRWSPGEIALVEEAAERIWAAAERARAEVALRESEERFRQFAAASAAGLWIRAAGTLAMEYVSPAIATVYGVQADALLGDVTRWAAMIVPEDRDRALRHLEKARGGEVALHEFRIRRSSDGEIRWIRNTDFPLRDGSGRVERIGGIAEDVTEAKRAVDRQEVLVNELQHRSRNLLGVVTSMANRTVGRGSSAESFLVRLKALSRAQALLSQSGSDTVPVEALVRAELAAHADNAFDRIIIDGPGVALTSQQMQNFALALHELTTNAVKYGALKNGTGHLSVTWELISTAGGRHLALDWVETGVDVQPEKVTRRGYGRELIEQALTYALGGRTEYALEAGGVRCRIELPVA